MLKQKLVEEFTAKVSEILAAGPAKDVEKNLKAALAALFAKLDLVTREEFDVQAEVLTRTREKLTQLEARLAQLEAAASTGAATAAAPAEAPAGGEQTAEGGR
jgi:BMFP domain-containing protein YqiC